MFNTKLSVTLRPEGVFTPHIRYGIDQIDMPLILLTDITTLDFNVDLSSGTHKFILSFENKTNETHDQAVIIESITVEGMTLDRFKWAGKYYPVYPEPWASQQTEKLPTVIDSSTYLGWNGRWELEFSVPIFEWIHRIENLGWIYK